MTAEKEVYIYPCQANTAMTIAVGDSCLLVSNAQAREMVDRIQEVLVTAECLMNSLLDLPPSEMHKKSKLNLSGLFRNVVINPQPQDNPAAQDAPPVRVIRGVDWVKICIDDKDGLMGLDEARSVAREILGMDGEPSTASNDDFDFNDSLAGQVAKIMRRHAFDFDQAMAIMKMARDTNAPN